MILYVHGRDENLRNEVRSETMQPMRQTSSPDLETDGVPATAPRTRDRLELVPSRPVSILVADDDPASRDSLESQLREFPVALMLAGTTEEALERWRNSPGFDLIIVNANMADQGGLTVIQAIRSIERLALFRPAVIYALTGEWQTDHIETLQEAGADGAVPLSARRDELARLIAQAGEQATQPAAHI